MNATLRRLHIWAGLLGLTSLIVMAVAGLEISLRPAGARQVEGAAATREVPYRAGAGLTDQAIAADLYRRLRLPLTAPIPAWALRRDDQQRLVLRFGSPNGVYRVTVLEDERKVRVEHQRTSLAEFLSIMHAQSFRASQPHWRLRLWGLYVNLSIFVLLFLLASGLWLWWESRPGLLWGRALLALGSLLFGAIWWGLR